MGGGSFRARGVHLRRATLSRRRSPPVICIAAADNRTAGQLFASRLLRAAQKLARGASCYVHALAGGVIYTRP